jgi:type VI protein secretion system component Hcp
VNSETFAYMHVKSSVQGEFLDDESQAGQSKTLCLAVRFRGEVPHDARKGSYAVTKHEPITVIGEWSPSTVQFLTSLWNNEVIDEVGFDFIRPDTAGKDEVYATLTLNQVTVAFVELRSGNTAELVPGEPRALDYIGFHAQQIAFKLIGPSGPVEASYARKASAT